MIASFTELKVKGLMAALKVALLTMKIRKQLKDAEGLVQFEVRGFKTLSIWKDMDAMKNFRNNGPHLTAMKRTRFIGSAASHTWEVDEVPSWEDAEKEFETHQGEVPK